MNGMEEWREFVRELKASWRMLWRDRIDDRVKAEGIADKYYPMLFVEKGLVILATRDYKPPSFNEILQKHMASNSDKAFLTQQIPSIGGWGKFIRDVLSKQKRYTAYRRAAPPKPALPKNRQLKKGGRGWIHRS